MAHPGSKAGRVVSWEWRINDDRATWTEDGWALFRPGGRGLVSFDLWLECVHPEDRARAAAAVRRSVATGERYDDEYRIQHPDGSVYWVRGAGEVEHDKDGSPWIMRGILVDITERRNREDRALGKEREKTEELRYLAQLYEVATQCAQPGNGYYRCLEQILSAAVSVTGAEKGNIQLVQDRTGYLAIAAQQGFDEAFMNFFSVVNNDSAATCRAAALSRERVLVEDVTESEIFRGQPSLGVLLDAGVRAVQSTPLVSSAGTLLGIISTYFTRPHRLGERQLRAMDLLARQAADYIERKHMEASLRESVERYSTLVEQAVDGIFMTDSDGRYLDANSAGLRMLGYTVEELRTKTIIDILAPEELARVPHALAELDTDADVTSQWRFRRKDGTTFPAEGVGRRLPDGRLLGILRDNTQRIETLEALRDSEERLRLATEAGHVGIFEIDVRTGHVRYSAELARILGFPEVRETSIENAIARIHRDDQARMKTLYVAALDPGSGGRLDIELRFVRPGGEVRWMAWSGRVQFAKRPTGPEAVRFVGTCLDITDRKHSEQAIAQLNGELEARVLERTNQLEREMKLREEAQAALAHSQRMEAIGQLTGGIAHDFNNLLTVISGNLEMVEAKVSDAGISKAVRRAIDAVDMGASLNRRLLSFARLRKLAPERLSINERVLEVTQLLRRTLGDSIELETNLASTLWPTRADQSEVDSGIINIAVNARDAMPSGGRLTIATGNLTVDSKKASKADVTPGEYICLTISDTGCGMAPEVLRKAIEPFFTTKEAGKGTGLGLSSVYGFVRQTGGFMEIESEVGHGTTIRLYLPRDIETAKSERSPRPMEGVPMGDAELILVIEDNDQVRQVTLARLESLGYTVLEASNGQEAIEILQSEKGIDLVLSDVAMPGGMSGYDVATWVHTHHPCLKVLLASGHNDIASGRTGEPPLRVLAKPYTRAALAHAVRDLLEA